MHIFSTLDHVSPMARTTGRVLARHCLALALLAGTTFMVAGAAAQAAEAQSPAAKGDDPVSVNAPAMQAFTAASNIAPSSSEVLAKETHLYRQHLTTLSNPFFEGRAPGTDGNRLAASYIEFHLRQMGLTAAFPAEEKDADGKVVSSVPNRSFRQIFTAPPSLRPGDSTKLLEMRMSWMAGDETVALQVDKDFAVLGYSGSGDVTAPLVFAGYATQNEEKKYNTFEGNAKIDGKIAIILRFEPMTREGKSRWSENGWSFAAALDAKIRLVERAGAAGIILVNPPGAADERIKKLEGLELSGNRAGANVPVIMMSIDAADALVRKADANGRTLMQLREEADNLAAETAGVIDLPGATATLGVKLERVPLLTDNVGGILAGHGDLADQYIIVGSHYDHVGYGYFGSRDPDPRGKIHPGADDNSSGSSGNLLIASKLIAAYKALPAGASARSVLFLWFSAEESGLVGSRYYIKNMIADKAKHSLMLNMDMIGRLREGKLELGGVGTADGLTDWLKPYIDASGLKIKASKSGYGPSDHASFTGAGIPSLFFFTQLHKEYHSPADTIDTINFEGGVQVADLCYRIALDAAQRPQNFVFSDGESVAVKAPTPVAAKPDDEQQASPGPVASGVRFGIAPGDYSGDEKGVLVGEVFPDLPAAKAGLKQGDLIIKWNDTPVEDVESWMPLLSKAKPGDVVTIVYKRKIDGTMQEQTTQATLIARLRRNAQ